MKKPSDFFKSLYRVNTNRQDHKEGLDNWRENITFINAETDRKSTQNNSCCRQNNGEIFHEHMTIWLCIWYGYYMFMWLLLDMNSHILPKQKEDRYVVFSQGGNNEKM